MPQKKIMTTKEQANKKLLSEMLNKCIELKAMQNDLISSDYHFDSLCTKILSSIDKTEVTILDCINDLNDAI